MMVYMKNFHISSIFDEYMYNIFDNLQANYQYIYPVKDECTRYGWNVHIMWKWFACSLICMFFNIQTLWGSGLE
jgi:hypothetical protein